MRPTPRLGWLLRMAGSLVLLGAVVWWLDVSEIVERLQRLDLRWVGAALVLSFVQVAASAWRWRYTADRLGIRLPGRTALREYYLATFLNQVLPGGVLGDVSRAWRHHRNGAGDHPGPVLRAVILERGSGQVVMALVAAVSFLALPAEVVGGAWWGVAGAVVVLGAAGAVLVRRRQARAGGWADGFSADLHRALLAPDALPVQLATSGLVVATYLGMYLAAARAVGATEPVQLLLPLVAPVLLAMLLPVTVAGWGAREGAAAALWAAVGLSGAEGVAISVVYGLLVLLSSLPGAWVLLRIVLDRPAPPEALRRPGVQGEGSPAAQFQIEEHVGPQAEGSAGRP